MTWSAADKYTPDSRPRSSGNLGRSLDLIAALIQKAEMREPVDCLILAVDRGIEEADSTYLSMGMERRFLELCGGKGATPYGLLEGSGDLGDLCIATGGLSLPGSADPAAILRQILEGRAAGHILEARCLQDSTIGGRFSLSVKAGGSAGHQAVRCPRDSSTRSRSRPPCRRLPLPGREPRNLCIGSSPAWLKSLCC